jgi:hypothetical protein
LFFDCVFLSNYLYYIYFHVITCMKYFYKHFAHTLLIYFCQIHCMHSKYTWNWRDNTVILLWMRIWTQQWQISKGCYAVAIHQWKKHNTQTKAWNKYMTSSIDEAYSSKFHKGCWNIYIFLNLIIKINFFFCLNKKSTKMHLYNHRRYKVFRSIQRFKSLNKL